MFEGERQEQTAMETPQETQRVDLAITHDPIACRVVIQELVRVLGAGPKSRARSLAITKLEEAAMWLNEALRVE
jgi:hypothetical protein